MAPGTSRCRGPGGAERGGPGGAERSGEAPGEATEPPPRAAGATHLLLLHEAHEGGALDLHGLPLPVVESQDEVEKVGLPQVGRRLLLEVSPGQTHSAGTRKTRVSGSPDDAASRRRVLPHSAPPSPCLPPTGTRPGSPGAEHHPPGPPPPGRPRRFSLRARGKASSSAAAPKPRGAGRAAQPRPHPGLRRVRSAKRGCRPPLPTLAAPGSQHRHPPTLPGGRARPQPALHGRGSRAQPRRRVAPRSGIWSCHFSNSARSCHPSAHVPYLFQFQSCEVFFFFFLPPLAGVAGKHRDGSRGDNLKYFRVVPAETFPSLEGSKGRGAGRGGRHREMSTLNFLADAGSRAQAANPASGAVGVCWVFSRGKRTGTRRNKRESEAGHSLANPAPI